MEFDPNALVNTAMGGGAVWVAIRAEIKFLWRDMKALRDEVGRLRDKLEILRSQ